MSKCCENCKWFKEDPDFETDHICCNDKSEYIADWVEENHTCDEWEGDIED